MGLCASNQGTISKRKISDFVKDAPECLRDPYQTSADNETNR